VRNSLGKYLEEHEEKIIEKYKLKSDITEKTYRKREIEAYTEYQKILQTVKVLDPACGSGAFLVRVFDFLLAENKRVRDIIYGEEGAQLKVGDDESSYRTILKNNIY
jgi:type II restriction/modification system DNA methylase subunit YeeA